MDALYEDIGKKIKHLAKVCFVVEAVGAVIGGFAMMVSDSDMIGYGLLTVIGGVLVAWVSSWVLYGFGELVDKTCDLEAHVRYSVQTTATNSYGYAPAPAPAPVMHNPTYQPVQPVQPVQQVRWEQPRHDAQPVGNGWRCACGRVHQNYETSCVCGVTKQQMKDSQNQ